MLRSSAAVAMYAALLYAFSTFIFRGAHACCTPFALMDVYTSSCNPPSEGGNNTVLFTVHDRDDPNNQTSTTSCELTWPSTEAPPTSGAVCEDPSWEFWFGTERRGTAGKKVVGWISGDYFGLRVEHTYHDESVGPCSKDGSTCPISTWGQRNVETDMFDCERGESYLSESMRYCDLKKNLGLEMPIVMAVARE